MVNQSVKQVNEASFNKSKLTSTTAISQFLFKRNGLSLTFSHNTVWFRWWYINFVSSSDVGLALVE